jgi:hypothetical protein
MTNVRVIVYLVGIICNNINMMRRPMNIKYLRSFQMNSKLYTFQTQRADGLNDLLPLFWVLCDNHKCGNSIHIMVFWVLILWWLVSEYQNVRGICHCHLHCHFEGSMKMMAASWFKMLVSAYRSMWCQPRRQHCKCWLVWNLKS